MEVFGFAYHDKHLQNELYFDMDDGIHLEIGDEIHYTMVKKTNAPFNVIEVNFLTQAEPKSYTFNATFLG